MTEGIPIWNSFLRIRKFFINLFWRKIESNNYTILSQ